MKTHHACPESGIAFDCQNWIKTEEIIMLKLEELQFTLCSYIWCKKNQIILSQPAGAFFLPIYLKGQETKGIFKWQFLPMLLKFQSFSPATAIFWTSLSGTITLHDHTTRSHFTISWLTSIWFSFMQGLPGKIPLGWVRNNDVILFLLFYFLSLFTLNIFWLLLDALTSDPTK